jgi:hypothetical protein
MTDMSPGVSRKAGTVELTRDDPIDPTAGAPLTGIALSPDGRWAAFISSRLRFTLPALVLTSDVRSVFGTDDLYVVDLQAGTVERAVRASDGGDADGVSGPLSLSADGRRIAFASGADNLFYGDANERTDVFVVDRLDSQPAPAAADDPPIDPPLEPVPPTPAPQKLAVTVRRAPARSIRLEVKAPVKGNLKVEVRGRVPDADGVPRGAAKLLAGRSVKVKKAGSIRVDVKLASKYRSALKRAGAIDARAVVTLTPAANATPLERSITVRFKKM